MIVICGLILNFYSCTNQDQNNQDQNNQNKKKDKKENIAQTMPTITIMTHDSFSVSKEVVADFQNKFHAKMVFFKSGDAGEALNKAILSKNNPMADIFYGVDNTFIGRALEADMFVPFSPSGLDDVDQSLKLDPQNRLVPVSFGDVCLNYDIKWFKENNKQPPSMLEDLILPEFYGLTIVENPATSSPGLAFLLATISRFGQDGYIEYWQQLKANKVLVTNGWKEAYWGKFSAASDGDRPIVVSYASSPAAEVFYAEDKLSPPPTGVVVENGSAFRQIEFAGILKGTPNLELAQKTMNFLLSKKFQEDIPLQMFVFPASKSAQLPEIFVKHAKITAEPAELSPQLIDANRDLWLRQWTEKILQ